MKLGAVACGLCSAAVVGIAVAQAAPPDAPLEDPEGHVIPELVVRARLPGPAWWTVAKGDAVVFILGLPDEPLPRGLTWDQSLLQRRLTGARALILPVRASAGLGDVPALLRLRGKLKSRSPMEDDLPETLRVRFAAARAGLGQPVGRYAHWSPLFAGQMLVDDFHHAVRAQSDQPVATIQAAARRLNAPARQAASFRVVDVLNPAIDHLTPEVGQRCLSDALEEVEAGAPGLQAMADAWARGDVPRVLAGPRGFSRCLLLLSGGADFWRRAVDQEAAAVSKALERPVRAVAIFPLRSIIAEGGVVDRLRSQGLVVDEKTADAGRAASR